MLLLGVVLSSLAFSSCQEVAEQKRFSIRNSLPIARQQETVSIPVGKINQLVEQYGADQLVLTEEGSATPLLTQLIDMDADGRADEILFQLDIGAGEEKDFVLKGQEEETEMEHPITNAATFSRFVPERIDDYAWENDRVAFRTYGPEAQRRTEAGEAGGTLSSGIDCWLKRVDYPVINKWYKAYQQDPNAYHTDRGEGYDPYHVGTGRGCGGIGILAQDSLYVSKNFTNWKRIATGPIRTIFELTYAPWQTANGQMIRETKRISLDLGSNLSFYEVKLESEQPLSQVAVGISLHKGEGEVKAVEEKGWYRYWEPMDGSALGLGIVMDPAQEQEYQVRKNAAPDQRHLLVLAEPVQGKLSYYAGFGWAKSGQFASQEEWDQYLEQFALRHSSPLTPHFR